MTRSDGLQFTALDCKTYAEMVTAVFLNATTYLSDFECVSYNATVMVVTAVLPTPEDVITAMYNFNGYCSPGTQCRHVIVDYFGLVARLQGGLGDGTCGSLKKMANGLYLVPGIDPAEPFFCAGATTSSNTVIAYLSTQADVDTFFARFELDDNVKIMFYPAPPSPPLPPNPPPPPPPACPASVELVSGPGVVLGPDDCTSFAKIANALLLQNVSTYSPVTCTHIERHGLTVTTSLVGEGDAAQLAAKFDSTGFAEFVFEVYGLTCGGSVSLVTCTPGSNRAEGVFIQEDCDVFAALVNSLYFVNVSVILPATCSGFDTNTLNVTAVVFSQSDASKFYDRFDLNVCFEILVQVFDLLCADSLREQSECLPPDEKLIHPPPSPAPPPPVCPIEIFLIRPGDPFKPDDCELLAKVAGALYLNESITVVSGGGFTCTSPPTEPSTWDLVLLPGPSGDLPPDMPLRLEQALAVMLNAGGLAQSLLQPPWQVEPYAGLQAGSVVVRSMFAGEAVAVDASAYLRANAAAFAATAGIPCSAGMLTTSSGGDLAGYACQQQHAAAATGGVPANLTTIFGLCCFPIQANVTGDMPHTTSSRLVLSLSPATGAGPGPGFDGHLGRIDVALLSDAAFDMVGASGWLRALLGQPYVKGSGNDVQLVMDFTNASAADAVFEYLTDTAFYPRVPSALFSEGRVPCGATVSMSGQTAPVVHYVCDTTGAADLTYEAGSLCCFEPQLPPASPMYSLSVGVLVASQSDADMLLELFSDEEAALILFSVFDPPGLPPPSPPLPPSPRPPFLPFAPSAMSPPPTPPTPPPPPTPYAPFPFCDCYKTTINTPFRLSVVNETLDKAGHNTYCLKTQVIGCHPSAPCCNMDLYKIELFMRNGCWGSVIRLTVDGEVMPTSYTQYKWGGDTYSTFKATKISMPKELANDVLMCMTLDFSCPTLTDFCYGAGPGNTGCQYAYFNADQTCCPTSWTPSFALPAGYPEMAIPPQFSFPVNAYYYPKFPGEQQVSIAAQANQGGV
ncbi:hypothetical protein FOA52_014389 [Chlamydomonas sp. UWO 241]|nr:hypothetical protein FOA52_014389 [Chlamydomonas sp. UWO 241]